MVQCCLGSTYKLETNDFVFINKVDSRFHKFYRVFWSFKPVIKWTFLYGKYHGHNCVLPTAFAIGDTKCLVMVLGQHLTLCN
ncbi:hypothetical protein CR513_17647, partial [Mucuna pruriens]